MQENMSRFWGLLGGPTGLIKPKPKRGRRAADFTKTGEAVLWHGIETQITHHKQAYVDKKYPQVCI